MEWGFTPPPICLTEVQAKRLRQGLIISTECPHYYFPCFPELLVEILMLKSEISTKKPPSTSFLFHKTSQLPSDSNAVLRTIKSNHSKAHPFPAALLSIHPTAPASKFPRSTWITHTSSCRSCFCNVSFHRNSRITMGKAISLTPLYSPQIHSFLLLVLRRNTKYSPGKVLNPLLDVEITPKREL